MYFYLSLSPSFSLTLCAQILYPAAVCLRLIFLVSFCRISIPVFIYLCMYCFVQSSHFFFFCSLCCLRKSYSFCIKRSYCLMSLFLSCVNYLPTNTTTATIKVLFGKLKIVFNTQQQSCKYKQSWHTSTERSGK